jgi:tellurite resistance protein TerC
MKSVGSPLLWALFAGVVVLALAVDLGLFNRKAHVVSMKEASVWTAVWATLALAFNGFVHHRFGTHKALEFMQGWLLEWSLSVDNVFVFMVIFRYFRVPPEHMHRVLFWGIIGAVITRGTFIAGGAALISRFHWVMYLLGAFLVFTGGKLLFQREEETDPGKNLAVRFFRRFVPTLTDYSGQRFVVRQGGQIYATPLLLVLVVVEGTDVVFAVDSIPAVFGVTRDVFIVFTSNIFAILGLRSLFFLIEALVRKLRFLKVGVAVILVFIGVKIVLDHWYPMPVLVSLAVLASVLAGAAVVSLLFPAPDASP